MYMCVFSIVHEDLVKTNYTHRSSRIKDNIQDRRAKMLHRPPNAASKEAQKTGRQAQSQTGNSYQSISMMQSNHRILHGGDPVQSGAVQPQGQGDEGKCVTAIYLKTVTNIDELGEFCSAEEFIKTAGCNTMGGLQ